MLKVEEILVQIEDLKKPNTLIREKDTLLDLKIVVASQKLDSALNECGKIAKKTNNQIKGKIFISPFVIQLIKYNFFIFLRKF